MIRGGAIMKFIIFIFLFSCASIQSYYSSSAVSPSFDYSKTYKLAIIPLEKSELVKKEEDLNRIYETLSMEFINTGKFRLIERKDIDKILNEQGFQYSGMVEPSQAVQFGKILGAELVAIYNVESAEKEGDYYRLGIYLKLINVENGEVMYYSRGRGEGFGKEFAIEDAVKNCLKGLKK